jgi:pimeloyl-ACP methyl ester carboxylesterase
MSARDLDPIRTGAHLYLPTEDGRWLRPADVTKPLVVLIHGFTANPRFLEDLATYLEGDGFRSALFSYDSFLGIDDAGRHLLKCLQNLTEPLMSYGVALLGHSMGGLVARYAAHNAPNNLRQVLRTVVLLGTPNRGTLDHKLLLSCFFYWGDLLSRVNPFTRSALCRSAKQLTLKDTDGLIQTLNQDHKTRALPFSFLSLSGGNNFLELEGIAGSFVARAYNAVIQRLIREKPNDGLVPESSADLSRVVADFCDEEVKGNSEGEQRMAADHHPGSLAVPLVEHRSDYLDYTTTNHTYLTRNYEIAGIVGSWLKAALRQGQTAAP